MTEINVEVIEPLIELNIDVSENLVTINVTEELNNIVLDVTEATNGLSAYQIAVENGFIGTESEWLLSLVGEKGDTGDAGTDALWNFTGAYNIGISYAVGDVATYNGETWYRINSNGGNVGDTPTEGLFWTLLAQKGQQGEQGIQGEQGEAGAGIATGGTTGQILSKQSNTDYDTVWIDNYAPNIEQYVKNQTGTTLYKGQVVYISGSTGNNAIVSLASATSEATSSKTFGILKQDLPTGEHGFVVTEGTLEGINTNAANEADSIWLGTTAGQMVFGIANKPIQPNHSVYLGVVIRKQTNNGKIYVKIQNGYEIEELHNVLITSLLSGHTLKYNGSLWVNSFLTKTDVGLSSVDNVQQIPLNQKGAINGVAELDGTGKVPSTQLPSFVDDILEYATFASLPITGVSGILYVTLDTNITYRWSGSVYVEVSQSLALGETSQTAYRGDRGKIAYDHSQSTGNPHGTGINDISGLQTALDTIPTETADLTESINHNYVTEAEKQTLQNINSLIFDESIITALIFG